MDDVKDKMKGLIKKVNNPFSNSSSGKFKGQGRVLGSSSPSSSSAGLPANPIRPHQPEPKPKPKPTPKPTPPSPPPPSSSSSTTTPSLNLNSESDPKLQTPSNPEILRCVDVFISGGASVDVISRLLKNIVKEPENPKFRKIRLSNAKIREAVVEVAGGVELLECVGFQLQEEEGEMWAVIIDVPSDKQIGLIKEAVCLLEKPPLSFSVRRSSSAVELEETALGNAQATTPSMPVDEPDRPQKIDRQVQVFFNAPESISVKIDVPESFYSLSATELKREADARKKQIAESQLLIPKSYKEKKAKEARRKYKTAVIRIQFPDEVVLQGVFLPWEPTTALYEFVSMSLKEPCLEFELWRPAVPKPRLIPRFPESTERTATLDEEELVPSALVKFKPIETDSMVFTGLSNELLQISQSLK